MPTRCLLLGLLLLPHNVLSLGEEAAWETVLHHGSVLGFPSYEEANTLLRNWLEAHPDKLRQQKIGESYLKRPIYGYVLGKASAFTANTPKVLITSLMHAREPASLTVVLYFIGHLLDLYSQGDPQATYVIESREIWLVPFVNPDGYIENEKLPRKTIRKNRRPTCRHSIDGGVDLNRNFGVHWSSQFSKCNEEYQGTEPFSEPETQAIKRICEENHFRTAVNFHSFGGMLTHPFNWARQPRLPVDDQHIYDEIAKIFGWQKFGPAISTVGYTADGESDDWMYGEHKIISMSPEVGPESGDFWPPAFEIPGINKRNFVRAMYVVRKAGLELAAQWSHVPLQMEQMPLNATQLAGGLPAGELLLVLNNRGMSLSSGSGLGVAVAGAAASARPASGIPAIVMPGATSPPRLLPSSLEGGLLSFEMPPLERRSSSRIRLLLGKSSEAAGPRELRICVAELGGSSRSATCQCSGPASVPAEPKEKDAEAAPSGSKLVLASSSKEDAELCKAAAAVKPAKESASVVDGTISAAAVLPTASPLLQKPGTPSLRISASGAPPSLATRTAVLAPAFEASGESSPSVALMAFAFTAFGLGACLAWQVTVGRRRGGVPTVAYKRPQHPPPLSPVDASRAPQPPSSFDDHSAGGKV